MKKVRYIVTYSSPKVIRKTVDGIIGTNAKNNYQVIMDIINDVLRKYECDEIISIDFEITKNVKIY